MTPQLGLILIVVVFPAVIGLAVYFMAMWAK